MKTTTFDIERLRSTARHTLQFLRLLLARFLANQSLQNAAAMTYTTLLSLVPLMAVSIALFSVFPIADKVSLAIQDFVFENFMPASGDVVQSYLDEFSGKAAQMTGTSFVFLVIVAIMLVASIDQAFNTIWRVKRKRGIMKMFMVYWSVISLGPILMALSIAVTSYVISLPMLSDAAALNPIRGKLLFLTPVLVSALAFMLLYSVIPNRPVPLRHAFAGGLVAAVLFEVAKRSFAFWVTQFPTYEAIYGALATVPIFLVWLYVSWVVTLLGAEFTYCLSIYRRQKESVVWQGDKLLDVLQVLARLWQAQQTGRTLSLQQLEQELETYTEEHLENLLIKLQKARLVHNTLRYEWALARDMSHYSLAELYRAMPLILPTSREVTDYHGPAATAIRELMDEINLANEKIMQVNLEHVFQQPDAIRQAPAGPAGVEAA